MPRMRRLRRALLFGLWLWLVCEVGAWATISTLENQATSHAVLRSRQLSLADQELRARREGINPRKRTRADRSLEFRHPYLGFVSKDADKGIQNIVFLMSPELGDPSSACFQEETFVVGIAGGSVATNLVRSNGRQWIRELEASPLLNGRKAIIVCLANAGHKQPQALISFLFLDSLGVKFDALLLLDGFNEIALHVGAAAKHEMLPAYPRQWVTRLGMGLAEGSLLARFDIEKADQANAAEAILESPARRSWIRQLLWYWPDRNHVKSIQSLESQLAASGEINVERTGPTRKFRNRRAQFQDLVGVWERSSRSLFELCQASDIRFLHFLQPNQYVEGSKPMGDVERAIAVDPEGKYAGRVQVAYPMLQKAGERLAAEGLAFHDLTGIFDGIREPLYVDTCCHVNREGSRLMGKAMLEALLATLN